MDSSTIELLEGCNLGCKMALNSMNQIHDFVTDPKLQHMLTIYQKKHKDLEDLSVNLLAEHGKCEHDPNVLVTTATWLSTEVKLYVNSKTDYIAKLLIKGCDMGIESLEKKSHKFSDANKEAQDLCNHLISLEHEFREQLCAFE